ncbi:MAG: hypothetical protein QNK37_31355 [Acidobacteriota bacterium]|nr:hypothetical protein [Acidobacteriota bacterium]
MSTSVNYSLSMREENRRRMNLALAQRQMERMDLEAQRLQGRVASLSRRLNNLPSGGMEQATQLRHDLRARQQELQRVSTQLARAQQKVQAEITELSHVYRQSERERAKLAAAMRRGEATMEGLNHLTQLNLENARDLERAGQIGAGALQRQSEIEARINQVSSELRFVTAKNELAPAAMATLLSMEERGYTLAEVDDGDDLVSYFRQAEREHHIAVRLQPMAESNRTWDLLAETFDMEGAACLEELDELETAFEELELGELSQGAHRVYPKDDSGLVPERSGILPAPAGTNTQTTVHVNRQYEG